MLGAIIGDIAGSRFEWNNHRSKDFNLFSADCFFTDDTVMTLAVAKALLDCKGDYIRLSEKTVTAMQEIGRPYPDCGYGGMFQQWMYSDNPQPYNSFGNGAAMRVSACGFMAQTLEEAKELSHKVTAVTHNHPEGIKGAEATTVAIFLARKGYKIDEIRKYINAHYYQLDFTLDEIRDTYEFNETCQNTVPQAIMAFLESTSFEDAIKNAISIGGDSDTIAAITGGIAEAYYGIPQELVDISKTYLDERLLNILSDFYSRKKVVYMPDCGTMHSAEKREIIGSSYKLHDGILEIVIEQKENELFDDDILEATTPSLLTAIVSINHEHDDTLCYAIELVKQLKANGTCVICICKNYNEVDENGLRRKPPIEIQLRELKKHSNTLIIVQKTKDLYVSVPKMLLSLCADKANSAKYLAEKFMNGNYTYYNANRGLELNAGAHMDYLIFDSLFICPIYLSKEVFCHIEGGGEFVLDQDDSMGDEGFMISLLSDYLQTDKIHYHVRKNPNRSPFAIHTQLLFCGLNEDDFAFSDDGAMQYVDIPDQKLKNRIKRMLTAPFHNQGKTERMKKYKERED